ncbi:MAG TPA: PA0069 family radical SAM protein [Planctomycetaceae bacterium]|jgi:DNA repair photolyase|nr:PA0069 family radical SAM protein [Planctomycetaceae bacterium]
MFGPPQNKKGRSAAGDPPNRFLTVHRELDPDAELGEEDDPSRQRVVTQFFPDQAETIVSENDSPDVPFRFSVNPYRGCEHGCSYCYARPSHEYLGLGAGLDFESKIFVKERAPELFARWLARDGWTPEMICFSGITDCYQPAERTFELTRGCLRVAAEARQPIGIITKNRLVTRDLDLLAPMAAQGLVHVSLSITTLDEKLARRMEPRTSRPSARLEAVRELTAAGVPTRVMIAPIIPGLNDSEIPQILKAAQAAGAGSAGHVLLRLAGAVRPVFLEWLSRSEPTHAARVEAAIRHTRDGKLNDTQFGRRMRGTGTRAEQIEQTFSTFARRCGLDQPLPKFDFTQFRPPQLPGGQLRLF